MDDQFCYSEIVKLEMLISSYAPNKFKIFNYNNIFESFQWKRLT